MPTVFAARQFVSHGHVTVNGRRVNIASFRCRVGDLVEVKEKGKQMALLLEAIKSAERDVPDYIEADHNKMTAKLVRVPGLERGAVPRAYGAEPGGRVLQPVIRELHRGHRPLCHLALGLESQRLRRAPGVWSLQAARSCPLARLRRGRRRSPARRACRLRRRAWGAGAG